MARIFVPKMWRSGAKIEWRGAAVALMRWQVRKKISSKNIDKQTYKSMTHSLKSKEIFSVSKVKI